MKDTTKAEWRAATYWFQLMKAFPWGIEDDDEAIKMGHPQGCSINGGDLVDWINGRIAHATEMEKNDYRVAAAKKYGSEGSIEIEHDADISSESCDGGRYVTARVWVEDEEARNEED